MGRYDNFEPDDMGERIVNLVNSKKGWTMKRLAKKLEITEGALSMKINGKRPFSLYEVILISEVFNVTLDEIVSGTRPENLNARRATGLSQKAIDCVHWFSQIQYRDMKALNYALSFHQVLDAIARYVSFVPTEKGYFLSQNVSEEDKFVYCSMSQQVFKSVLGQNLLNMLDEIRSGEQYSKHYQCYEDFKDCVNNDKLLAEPGKFKKEEDSGETTER